MIRVENVHKTFVLHHPFRTMAAKAAHVRFNLLPDGGEKPHPAYKINRML